MKILYFTSTGNSLHVAKKIGGELLSIPQLRKNNIYEINDDIVGIISPVYMWDIPRPVRLYLKNVKIKAEYIFVVMTCGGEQFGAAEQMKKLLDEKNIRIHYSNIIKMVDNYLPLYEISKELSIKNNEDIEKNIDSIVNDINTKKQFIMEPCMFKKILIKLLYSTSLTDIYLNNAIKRFIINDNCDGCKICHKVCPMGNIYGSGKPEYSDRCEFCLACIHHCPKNAIHLKNQKSNKRFINENIKLSEIINANKQN